MCPASGRTTSWRAGDAVTQRSPPTDGGVSASSAPTMTSVGQVMAASPGRASGRVFSASRPSTMPSAVLRLDDRLELLRDRAGRLRRRADQLRQHRLQHRLRAALARRGLQAHAVGLALVGVGLGAGVGEDQRPAALRREAMHGERDVAAHRQAADDRVLAAQVPQQRQHVVGVVVDRQGRRPARLSEVAQVGRDERPAVRRGRVQRLPHAGVEREPVQQDHRASPAGLQPRDRLPPISTV